MDGFIDCISELDLQFEYVRGPQAQVTYLDAAGRSPLPRLCRQVGEKAMLSKSLPWSMQEDPAMLQRIRGKFADIIGAESAEDIAIVPSTSYALSSVARNLQLQAGQRVLVLQDQMGSNVMPWQALCERCGGCLHVVPRPTDFDWTAAVLQAMEPTHGQVGVVAIPNCHWTDGSMIDVLAVGQRCQTQGAHLVLDITQSAGVVPLPPLASLAPAAVCASVHKWLLGPYGACLLYVGVKAWQTQGEPLEHFERNRLGASDPHWDAMGAMTKDGYPTAFESGSRRFDSGGRPNPILLPMLDAALQHVLHWRDSDALATMQEFTQHIATCARRYGITVPPNHAPHIIGLRWNENEIGTSPTQFAAFLKKEKVYVSVRSGAVRVSVDFYVTWPMVHRFCGLLERFFNEKNGRINSRM